MSEKVYTEEEVARLQGVEVQNALKGLLRNLEAVREQRQASALAALHALEPAWYQYRGEVVGLNIAIQAVKRRLR